MSGVAHRNNSESNQTFHSADDNDGLLPPAKTLSDWFRSAYTATPPTKPSQDEAKPAKSSSSSSSSSRAKGKRWVDSNRLLVSLRLRERLVAAGARREELNSRFLELRNAYVRQLRLIQMEKVVRWFTAIQYGYWRYARPTEPC